MRIEEIPEKRPVMTAKQVAEYFGVSRRHVYELAKKGGLPSFRIGSVPRFYRRDIENLPTTASSPRSATRDHE